MNATLFAPPQPLAMRLRPRSLEEFVGQQHLVGPADGYCAWHVWRLKPLFGL